MENKKIKVTINKDTCEIKAEAEGFTGNTCEQALEFIKNMGSKTSTENKSEFYSDQQIDGQISL